jgi:3-oxoacyl-[acyl-carrier-protein] synthase II
LDRDGFAPAEGAATVVLESVDHAIARGASILAEVVGYGCTSDAYHPVVPEPTGTGASRAMTCAMADAGVGPYDIDYINAHGTSTQLNDVMETRAVKHAFGPHRGMRIPISATKSMTGHLGAASGALEVVACVCTIRSNIVHPTINYETPDPECDLDHVANQARSLRVDTVLTNSFGFGGHNVSLVLRRYAG